MGSRAMKWLGCAKTNPKGLYKNDHKKEDPLYLFICSEV